LVDPNTRQGKRTPVTLKIKFKSETLEQFIERYAVDVSQGGIFIRTKEPLAVGTQMRFEFQLRDASPLIGGEGTVVWTRENDPSRPAIAPGMGVRFDRLAEGSQTVLERILAEKAKQAPQRPPTDTTKPPLFTDTPTRVAPPPVQEALLGNDSKANRRRPDSFNDQHTPLPKPMPFHSDADEFPEEAFEEATKVRALDELVAQTALDPSTSTQQELGDALFPNRDRPLDELALRRGNAPTVSDPEPMSHDIDPSSTSPGFASGRGSEQAMLDRDSAPGLPNPPEPGMPARQPHRLLDTSPSPRTEHQTDPMEKLARTKLGMEPVHVSTRPTGGPSIKDAVTRPSGMAAIPADPTASVRMPAKKSSAAPIIILILVLLAAAGAGVWFFVIRDRVAEDNEAKTKPVGSGSQVASGSNKTGSGSDGSDGSNGSAEQVAPAGPTIETEIVSSVDKSTVEIVGTDQTGPAPFKAKLEKDKMYKAHVIAPGYATLEIDLKGGQDKVTAKLVAKPRVINVTSVPSGALISVDGGMIGHSTPFDVELTKAQAAKKSVRIGLRKNGFRAVEKVVDTAAFVEDASQMVAKLDEQLVVQQVVIRPPTGSNGSNGSNGSTGSNGSAGSAESGSATPPAGSGTPPAGSGTPTAGSNEPTPDFAKDKKP
jgi:uncharacterized protein (TIGR02266 family)